jgi:hypothetical protein
VASGLVDHPEAVPAVMQKGETFEEFARCARGFVELAGMNEVDGVLMAMAAPPFQQSLHPCPLGTQMRIRERK